MCKFTLMCLLVSAKDNLVYLTLLTRQQNGPLVIGRRRLNGRTALLATLHTTDLPDRRKRHLANRATKLNGETGTMQHRVLTI